MHSSTKSTFLQYAIEEMKGVKKRQPSQSELDKYFAKCGGPWKKADGTVHWCGIFTAYLLRKAGARIRWIMGYGINNIPKGSDNPDGRISTQWIKGNKGISIGDIAVRDKSVHHFIVLS